MMNPGGHEYNYIAIRPSQIRYAAYQRDGIIKHIEYIDAHYDGDIQNEPKLSFRDGIYWCFDGQQTISAWTRRYDDTPILCKVFAGLTYQDEARLFAYQTGGKPITAVVKFNSEVQSGNLDAISIRSAVESAGYKLSEKGEKYGNIIAAVKALKDAYAMLGYDKLAEMLNAIKAIWGDNEYAIGAQIIGGMAVFYNAYKDDFKTNELIKSLRKPNCMPLEIIAAAKTMGDARRRNIARVILTKYNHQRKIRLPDKL